MLNYFFGNNGDDNNNHDHHSEGHNHRQHHHTSSSSRNPAITSASNKPGYRYLSRNPPPDSLPAQHSRPMKQHVPSDSVPYHYSSNRQQISSEIAHSLLAAQQQQPDQRPSTFSSQPQTLQHVHHHFSSLPKHSHQQQQESVSPVKRVDKRVKTVPVQPLSRAQISNHNLTAPLPSPQQTMVTNTFNRAIHKANTNAGSTMSTNAASNSSDTNSVYLYSVLPQLYSFCASHAFLSRYNDQPSAVKGGSKIPCLVLSNYIDTETEQVINEIGKVPIVQLYTISIPSLTNDINVGTVATELSIPHNQERIIQGLMRMLKTYCQDFVEINLVMVNIINNADFWLKLLRTIRAEVSLNKSLHVHYVVTAGSKIMSVDQTQLQQFFSMLGDLEQQQRSMTPATIIIETVTLSQSLFSRLHQILETQVFLRSLFEDKVLIYNQPPTALNVTAEWLTSWRQIVGKCLTTTSKTCKRPIFVNQPTSTPIPSRPNESAIKPQVGTILPEQSIAVPSSKNNLTEASRLSSAPTPLPIYSANVSSTQNTFVSLPGDILQFDVADNNNDGEIDEEQVIITEAE